MIGVDSIRKTLQRWLEEKPEASQVKNLRRRVAADPELESLAEVLLTVEHRLRTRQEEPFRPLVRYVRGEESGETRQLHLTLHKHAPYPELRRALLEHLSEGNPDLEVDFTGERQATAYVTGPMQRLRLEALYHWSVRDVV